MSVCVCVCVLPVGYTTIPLHVQSFLLWIFIWLASAQGQVRSLWFYNAR